MECPNLRSPCMPELLEGNACQHEAMPSASLADLETNFLSHLGHHATPVCARSPFLAKLILLQQVQDALLHDCHSGPLCDSG